MGKSQRLKEQRKVEALRKELRKEAKWKMFRTVTSGVALGIVLASLAFWGIKTIDNKFLGGKKVISSTTKSYKTGDHKYSQAPDMQVDPNKTYLAKFETVQGNFEVTLNAKDAPKTTNNFVALAKDGFYDGLTFHRIVKDFMIQGGDPDGTGGGGPGYKFDDEAVVGDYSQGTIAMANSGQNTNGSQFFIMTGDYSNGKLPKNYVIFGKVSSGLDIVMKLNETVTTDNGQGENSKPIEKVVINKVTIEEK